MKKGLSIILILLMVLLLAGTGLMVFGILLPYRTAQADLPVSGQLVMQQQPEGTWRLSWPEVEGADSYRIEIDGESGELLYREFAGETSHLLPQLPADRDLTIRVTPIARFRTLLGEKEHYNETSLEATACFAGTEISVMDFYVDGDEKTVRVDVQSPEDGWWSYQLWNGESLLQEETLTENSLVLHFGDGAIALPEDGGEYYLRFRACRETADLQILGVESNDFRVTAESLQERKLNPVLKETAKNTISITWDETRGTGYEVQILDGGSWKTAATITTQEERAYIALLEPGDAYEYRVVSMDEQGEPLQASESLTAKGRDRIQYATVWPVRDLAAYSSASMNHVVATAKVGTAYCVLEEVNGMFAVQIDGEICYIDNTYCMINLPEYLGGLCSYNITNSVYAIYAVHEFAIPNVTGVVTAGYEDICQEDGTYLVPLLYPTAKKLLNAVEAARELGYRLKIYDSFRPYIATREIYDLTSLVMDMPVPDTTYTGVPRSSMELPNPRAGSSELTIGWLMTGSNYELNSFLARGGSAHNLGIALDLTLEKWDTGEQILMQTSMHDLSHYSVVPENNEPADLLGQIMSGAGFGGLISEWWHFQDNNAKNNYGLTAVIEGVNAACWMKDDNGWKYRGAKGGYYAGQTVTISGTEYTFDANGYVVE